MSQPISTCIQMKAIVDEETRKKVFEIFKSNHLGGGHYTSFGCSCEPNCMTKHKITQEMIDKYNEKLTADWKAFMDEHDKESCLACGDRFKGPQGVQGKTEY